MNRVLPFRRLVLSILTIMLASTGCMKDRSEIKQKLSPCAHYLAYLGKRSAHLEEQAKQPARPSIYARFSARLTKGGSFKELSRAFETSFHPDKAAVTEFTVDQLTTVSWYFKQHFELKQAAR